jgi:hypothetical protein
MLSFKVAVGQKQTGEKSSHNHARTALCSILRLKLHRLLQLLLDKGLS